MIIVATFPLAHLVVQAEDNPILCSELANDISGIAKTEVIYLSWEDQQRFAEELIDPSPLAPTMERAIERYKELVGSA